MQKQVEVNQQTGSNPVQMESGMQIAIPDITELFEEAKNATTAQEAYDLLKDVPEEQWLINKWSCSDLGACCAIGHYARLTSSDPSDYSYENCNGDSGEPAALIESSIKYLRDCHGVTGAITSVNDGEVSYPGMSTSGGPKARSLGLLEDMIKAGY